jgi:hypothetical protein
MLAGTRKRRRTWIGVGVVAVVAFIASACVTNAGEFTLTVKPGTDLTLTDTNGNPTLPTGYGIAACVDGLDNDLDGMTDFGSDAQCDSSVDGNERIDGVQTYVPVRLPIDVDAAGNLTIDPAELTSQQVEICYDSGSGIWCLGITLTGSGSPHGGTINTETGSISLPLALVLDVDALVGFPGLSGSCSFGPINATYVADSYNTTTGATELVSNNNPLGAVTNCGSTYNSLFNSLLALPGQVDGLIKATILNASGNPIAFSS